MMPFAVATPETETVKKAHRRTLDLEEKFPEKASFQRLSEDGSPVKEVKNVDTKNTTTETVTKQETTR